MKVFFNYIRLSVKLWLKHIPAAVLAVFLLVVIMGGTLWGTAGMVQKRNILDPVPIVIASNDPSNSVIIKLAEGMESVKSICTLTVMPEKEAKAAFDKREYAALIYLPDDFVADVKHGTNTAVQVYMHSDEAVAGPALKELFKSGMGFVATTEAGVYTLTEFAQTKKMQMGLSQMQKYMTGKYFNIIFERNRLYESVEVTPFENGNVTDFYKSSLLLAVILLSGCGCGHLYSGKMRSLDSALKAVGMDKIKIASAKIIILVLNILLPSVLLIKVLNINVTPCFFAVAVSAAAMHHMLYRIFKTSAPVAVLLFTACILVLGGALVPSAWLSSIAQEAGAFIPEIFLPKTLTAVKSPIFATGAVISVLFIFIGEITDEGLTYIENKAF